MSRAPDPIRLGVVCDYLEERWPSMDLVGEMILDHLAAPATPARSPPTASARPAAPARPLPGLGPPGVAPGTPTASQPLPRLPPRPPPSSSGAGRFDLYHLVDHSYGQLVHVLPPGRAVVTCHDLDTFRCLLDPAAEPRPRWFRAMARRILDGPAEGRGRGLRQRGDPRPRSSATASCPRSGCASSTLGPPRVLPRARPRADAEAAAAARPASTRTARPSSCTSARTSPASGSTSCWTSSPASAARMPGARLVKVGGGSRPSRSAWRGSLGIADAIAVIPYFDPKVLASARPWRPSTAARRWCSSPARPRGSACPWPRPWPAATAVLASDIPVLREVGGDAAVYAPRRRRRRLGRGRLARPRRTGADRSRPGTPVATPGSPRAVRFAWTTHVGSTHADVPGRPRRPDRRGRFESVSSA